MKKVIVILLATLVFFACSFIGYQLANRVDPAKFTSSGAASGRVGQGEQHNLVILQVDHLDSYQPKLVSIWFASLYFMQGNPPMLTFGQLYPTRSNNNINQSIARSFALDGQGEPSTGFLRNLETYKIKWEGYLLVDAVTVERVMEWVNGPGDYISLLSSGSDSSTERNQLALQSCRGITGIDTRQSPTLQWGDLVPAHFRSNLHMEDALAYWNRVTTARNARCEILPAR